jgi:hypothetical protein
MDWDRIRDRLENPILVKHLRSRLRKEPLIVSIVVVMVLGICIVWASYQVTGVPKGGMIGLLFTLQTIILVVMGAAQIASSISGARASGILDFHRVSPLTPTELTLGFFFGAPIREYVLFACTLPFSAVFLAAGSLSMRGFIQLMIVLFTTAWILHGLSLLSGLISKVKVNSAVGGTGVFLVVFFLGGPLIAGGIFSTRLVEQADRLTFFGISLPWLSVVLLYEIAVLFFVYLATRRLMQSDRIHPLSKPQAIAALATLAMLALGGIWGLDDFDLVSIGFLYVLVVISILLVMMVTPNRSEYLKGLRRARKQGRTHSPAWDDLALNRLFLVVACAIVLAAGTLAWNGAGDPKFGTRDQLSRSFPLAIATAVLTIAYFGLALQFFLLWIRMRAIIFFGLFLFLIWIVPLLGGVIVAMVAMAAPNPGPENQVVLSLSPWIGLALVAAHDGAFPESYRIAIQAAALMPALLFTFVFNGLYNMARRRVHDEAMVSASQPGEKVSVGLQRVPVSG